MKKLLLFVGIFFISVSHFNTQAMVVSDLVAKGLAVGTGVATSGGMMLLLSQPHVAAIALPGFVFGGLSYLGLREYTPDYLLYRADQTKKEMLNESKIGRLMTGEITIKRIDGISTNGCPDASKAADDYELRFKKYIVWLKLVEEKKNSILLRGENPECYSKILNMNKELDIDIEKMHEIRSLINSADNRENYEAQLKRYNDANNFKLETRKVDNEEIRATAKKTEANAKLNAVRLMISEWGYDKLILAPITFFIFLWSLKLLPYPSF